MTLTDFYNLRWLDTLPVVDDSGHPFFLPLSPTYILHPNNYISMVFTLNNPTYFFLNAVVSDDEQTNTLMYLFGDDYKKAVTFCLDAIKQRMRTPLRGLIQEAVDAGTQSDYVEICFSKSGEIDILVPMDNDSNRLRVVPI